MLGRCVWRVIGFLAASSLGPGLLTNCGGTTSRSSGSAGSASAAPHPNASAGAGGKAATTGVGGSAAGSDLNPPEIGGEESCPSLVCEDPTSPYWHPHQRARAQEDGCPVCAWIPSCAGVACRYGDTFGIPEPFPPKLQCHPGFTTGMRPGACCYDCVRTDEPLEPPETCAPCSETPLTCAIGYRAITVEGACCPKCQADPNYCNTDDDCLLARRPANCCACPTSISKRLLDADACYTPLDPVRATPPDCPTDLDCSVIDCACAEVEPTRALCFEHHCEAP